MFKGRVVTPTVRNDVTVKENVIQSKEPAIKILNPLEGLSEIISNDNGNTLLKIWINKVAKIA
ncbi:hypothetical protein EO98_19285 [Methanosarcina sp. 2.H.T.1A.6]|nr:hypothetical protein EO98_19285 [Methanosarcina sp. 2.H.T.1A.6]KKG25557.1 hypothetical protein EO96_18560 [Methanosarcina sp. 2.H.T.1A.8]